MVLLQVCHRWRIIAIATPALWTDIVILSSDKDSSSKLEAARLYVERSGSCPISLTWHHHGLNQDPVLHDVLFPAASRLKNVVIFTNEFSVRDSLLNILEATPFPILEYLRCNASQFPYPAAVSLRAANLHAPRLRHGIFTNYMIPAGTLSSLVTLEIILLSFIRHFVPPAFFDLLRNVAQTLECLRFRSSNRVLRGYTPIASKIQLPELGILDLRSTSELLLFISTPNLHTLSLEGHVEDTISPFISFDAPKLTHLKLETLPLPDLETIPDLPWRFQQLEIVMLYRCQSSKSFFHHASSVRRGITAFPSLHSIVFNDPDAFPSIRSMVEGWRFVDPYHPTLKRVRFVTLEYSLRMSDEEWMAVQGIEFSNGPSIGESWVTTVF